MHWLFDRGLITIAEDRRILLANNSVPEPVRGLLNADGLLRVPKDSADWPHPVFLKHHREVVACWQSPDELRTRRRRLGSGGWAS